MAIYKDGSRLTQTQDAAFDADHNPGIAAPHAGIYRCTGCDHEIGIAAGHTLPSQGHSQHGPNQGPIRWRLLVYAVHKS